MPTRPLDAPYLKANVLAIGAALLMILANGAVGIVGSEENPGNRLFSAVVLVGILGSLLVRFRPRGMAWVMYAMTASFAAIAAYLAWTGQGVVPLVAAVFGAAWIVAGRLFLRSDLKP